MDALINRNLAVTLSLFMLLLSGCFHTESIRKECVKHEAGLSGCSVKPDVVKKRQTTMKPKRSTAPSSRQTTEKIESIEMKDMIRSMIPYCPMHFGFEGVPGQEEMSPDKNYEMAAVVLQFMIFTDRKKDVEADIRRMFYTCQFLSEQKYGTGKSYWPLKIFNETIEPL